MTSVETSSPSFQTSVVFSCGVVDVLMQASLRRTSDAAGERARGGHCGRAEEHLRLRIAHASEEIAIGGGESDFAVAERTLVHAETAAAAGVHDDGAGIDELADHA